MKAYLKRGSPDALSREEIETHAKNLRTSRERLLSPPPTLPHCAPFARELETDRALYLMRQYAHGTLYDRLFTRPFLSRVQKKWIAFQLLHALSECHERGVVHGDVKCENVLLTSRGWAFLADFATFKPGSLPADNPADYSYYFDTGGRRRCYVAPERFRDGGGDRTGGGATPAADVFSLGCVFGELFLDGAATFDYSQLLAYRRGEFDLRAALAPVGDDDVVDMIAEMCARDPAARPSAKACLDARSKRGGFFPAYFDALHDFCGGLLTADADEAAAEVRRAFDPLMAAIVEEEWRKDGGGGETASRATPSPRSVAPSLKEFDGGGDGGEDADEEKESSMAGLMADISNLAVTSDAGGGGDGGDDLFAASRSVDSPSASASSSSRAGAGASPLDAVAAAGATCPGAALVASLVCATLRGASSPSARRALLKLLARVAAVADDDARLQVIVPHAIDRVGDTAAVVRAAAVKTLASTLPRVRSHPASDAKVFPEFIWPSLSGLARDREESVRVAYAAALAALASASERFLRRGGGGGGSGDEEAAAAEVASFEDDLAGLRDVVRGIVLDYLTPDGAPGDYRNDAAAAAAAAPVRAPPGSRRPPPPAPPPARARAAAAAAARRRRFRPRGRPVHARGAALGRARARVVLRPGGRERLSVAAFDHVPQRPRVVAARDVLSADRVRREFRGTGAVRGVLAAVHRAVPLRRERRRRRESVGVPRRSRRAARRSLRRRKRSAGERRVRRFLRAADDSPETLHRRRGKARGAGDVTPVRVRARRGDAVRRARVSTLGTRGRLRERIAARDAVPV